MSAIANQWTGNGQAVGTTVTNAKVGSSVTYSVSGSPSSVFTAAGYRTTTSAASDIARMDTTLGAASPSVRTQLKLSTNAIPESGSAVRFMEFRAGSTNVGQIQLSSANKVLLYLNAATVAGSTSPTIDVDDVLLVDAVWSLNPNPTTSNGRIFFRVKNLTNASWNSGSAWFFDTGWTVNVGTANCTGVRLGACVAGLASGGIATFEQLGWEGISQVAATDTSQAAATAYFADAPSTPIAIPYVSLTTTSPTSVGSSDGSITATWAAIPNATSYATQLVHGAATSGFVADTTNITTLSKTYTGLSAGLYTVAVQARA